MSRDESDQEGEPKLPPGTVIGEYEIQGLLGEGGFGSVYRAVHPVIGKPAAVKVLKREFSAKPEMVARFVSEARAVNQIRHKNIIDIFSFGKLDDGRQFFVMELLEGVSLDQYIGAHGPLAPAQALPILRQLAKALGAAHAAGITHRDIKPENVFLTFDDEGQPLPKLLDFGIAKLVTNDLSQHKTRSGVPMGTPLFMSPEQVHGRDVNSRSDIYSFGILVVQLLTGKVPFTWDSMMSVMMKQVSEPPPKPSSMLAGLPSELDPPILHMLEKDPEQRPASVIEAVNALAKAARSAGLTGFTPASLDPLPMPGATPSGAGVRLLAQTPAKPPGEATIAAFGASDTLVASETPSFAQPSQSPAAAPKRPRWPWIAAIGATLTIGVVAVAVAGSGGSTPAQPAASSSPSSSPSASSTSTAAASSSATAMQVVPVSSAAPSASAAPKTTVELVVASQPAGAEIWQGAKKLGVAGAPITLPRGEAKLTLTLKKAGYQPAPLEIVPDRDAAPDPVVLKPMKTTEYGTL